jgi:hypothetical protein
MTDIQVKRIVRLPNERVWVVTLSSGNVYTYPMYLARSSHSAVRKAIRDEMKAHLARVSSDRSA